MKFPITQFSPSIVLLLPSALAKMPPKVPFYQMCLGGIHSSV